MSTILRTTITTVALVAALGITGLIPAPLSAAGGVIAQRVIDAVVDWVGEGEVTIEGIDRALRAAVKQEAALAEQVASNRVDAQLTEEKRAELVRTEAALRSDLAVLGPWIESGETIVLAGGERWDQQRIQAYAKTLLTRHETLVQIIASYEETAHLYSDAAMRAEQALTDIRQEIESVAAQRDLLLALVAQNEAQKRSGSVLRAAPELAGAKQSVQALIDAQRRANLIEQELQELSQPQLPGSLQDAQGAALLDQIRQATSITSSN